jgi:hypothetical protein
VRQTHQTRNARTVQVDVQQSHLATVGGQKSRQVGGYGALAYATLARKHEEFDFDPAHLLGDLTILFREPGFGIRTGGCGSG